MDVFLRQVQQAILEHCENEAGIVAIFLTGSRAMGIHLPQSDYDLLTIVASPARYYLSLRNSKDAFVFSTEAGEQKADITVWDLRKALSLFRSSNPTLIEALLSEPIVDYYELRASLVSLLNDGFWNDAALVFHYTSRARKATASRNKSPKVMLASLGDVIKARWVEVRATIPPVNAFALGKEIPNLYDAELASIYWQLVQARQTGQSLPDVLHSRLLDFIDKETQRLKMFQGRHNNQAPQSQLDTLFIGTLIKMYGNTLNPEAC